MSDQLSPEQRAEAIIPAALFWEEAASAMRADIAAAIRAAETAERARCAKEAEEWAAEIREENTHRGRVNQVAEHAAEMVEAAAKRIRRARLSTEASHG